MRVGAGWVQEQWNPGILGRKNKGSRQWLCGSALAGAHGPWPLLRMSPVKTNREDLFSKKKEMWKQLSLRETEHNTQLCGEISVAKPLFHNRFRISGESDGSRHGTMTLRWKQKDHLYFPLPRNSASPPHGKFTERVIRKRKGRSLGRNQTQMSLGSHQQNENGKYFPTVAAAALVYFNDF